MNMVATNEGGWKNTSIRTYLNGEKALGILSNKDYIKTVKKEYNVGNKQKENAEILVEDKLWLLACSEIFNSRTVQINGKDETLWGICLSNESSMTDGIDECRYKFYAIKNPSYNSKVNILQRPKTTETTPSRNWWLRSPSYCSNSNYCYFSKDGKLDSQGSSAQNKLGVAPSFSI